jgi:hypothetical protein
VSVSFSCVTLELNKLNMILELNLFDRPVRGSVRFSVFLCHSTYSTASQCNTKVSTHFSIDRRVRGSVRGSVVLFACNTKVSTHVMVEH